MAASATTALPASASEMAADPGTIFLPPYDPSAPVDRRNQIAQLVSICVLNSLTLIIIVLRTWYRGTKLKRYRADDKWIMGAGVLLAFPLFACQIGTNMYGSGLHAPNIKPEWQEPHWKFSWGWSAAYIVSAMIRVSVCSCLLDIVPYSFKTLRRSIYGLCGLLVSMAITLSLIWLFQYRPFMANFDYNVDATTWISMDPPRYLWAAMSVPIDLGIISIPYIIIKKTKLQSHERKIIFLVFAAQLLGTFASVFGIYGVWLNRAAEVQDIYYNESVWVILLDLEIFMYTLGATFPMFSRFFILKAAPTQSQQNTAQLTWFRGTMSHISNRFSSLANTLPARARTHSSSNHSGSNSRSYKHMRNNSNSISISSPKSPQYNGYNGGRKKPQAHARSESEEEFKIMPSYSPARPNVIDDKGIDEWGKSMEVHSLSKPATRESEERFEV